MEHGIVDLRPAPPAVFLVGLVSTPEIAAFDVPTSESWIWDADEGIGYLWRCRRSVADESSAWQIHVELGVFALDGERSPEACSLKSPEGVFITNIARTDGRIGEMEISTARIGSVYEEGLIVAGLAVSHTRAEEQDLRQAIDFAVDRGGKCAPREGQILIASKAGEERGVINAAVALTEDASRQAVVIRVVHGGGADLTIDIPGIDERRALHGVDEAIAGFILKRVERFEVTNSKQQWIVPDLKP